MTAYAIYGKSAAHPHASGRSLESIAVVNLGQYNISQPAAERPYTAFTLPPHLANWSAAKVRRLTAAGTDAKPPNITFAGQYVDADGMIAGRLALESVKNGEVFVAAGEAVLISV